jgi:hypothetical protein
VRVLGDWRLLASLLSSSDFEVREGGGGVSPESEGGPKAAPEAATAKRQARSDSTPGGGHEVGCVIGGDPTLGTRRKAVGHRSGVPSPAASPVHGYDPGPALVAVRFQERP